MAEKRVVFRGWWFPALLLLPQLAITLIFFVWPAVQAVRTSFYQSDAFGFGERFVGLANYTALFASPGYLDSIWTTIVFSLGVTALTLTISLGFAAAVDRIIRGNSVYTAMLVWPYAIAPAVAGVLWWFMFDPSIGIIAYSIRALGISWNNLLDGNDAMILVVVAAAWRQISYNFIFFLAGLQSIPRSMHEAAAIDGAGPLKRFFTIVLPLLSPTLFFLIVIDIVYAFFETFGVIDATTRGGPGHATTTLVYKAFQDGFLSQNFGSSAAQSVVLTIIVVALTVIQFRFVERRVHY
ncbi:sn-glycerol-3-phosphate ABC transporter permease UgpA [Jiella sp. MQZ9-1]|uniref:sn-glycerol-3-phosphate transport system permease protein UgpA n=1 Tax=Jiella flava TaxID=2816857 RepID=A0A939FWQ7_9HYPH|nr:sn-glycerol-3-phosphate ABC transporter permease UgpA [Jiella flava]MBO0662922.1 sn-glycerol-3-phosphate ABC transporter permease UgpA [Jiella flava]MCD2471318.1 sn-glycerol-3-phosphate ABC transporter permease UgpA [Jiella flava]